MSIFAVAAAAACDAILENHYNELGGAAAAARWCSGSGCSGCCYCWSPDRRHRRRRRLPVRGALVLLPVVLQRRTEDRFLFFFVFYFYLYFCPTVLAVVVSRRVYAHAAGTVARTRPASQIPFGFRNPFRRFYPVAHGVHTYSAYVRRPRRFRDTQTTLEEGYSVYFGLDLAPGAIRDFQGISTILFHSFYLSSLFILI